MIFGDMDRGRRQLRPSPAGDGAGGTTRRSSRPLAILKASPQDLQTPERRDPIKPWPSDLPRIARP